MADRIRLGFIGANVRATWAAQSHFPALLASPDVELTAVCTTRRETAEAAREAFRREARVHRFPGDGGIEGDRRGGRGGARAGALRADQGVDRSRQARLH